MPKRKRHSPKRPGCLVHWFRKGLRLHDNPALKEGLKGANGFRCIYILDPWFAGSCSKGVNRWRFLLECLEDLDSSLRKLNSRLFLIRGQPADVLPRLFKEWMVTRLSFEEDSEPFGRRRDKAISTLAAEAGVKIISKVSHTLYDPQEVLALNNNEPPMTYKRFQDIISMMGIPVYPVDALEQEDIEGLETFIEPSHDDKYGIPTLEELGFDTDEMPTPVWIGGESEAKQRLDRHLERKAWVANFERPRMSPASLMASPAGLSPYLRFGCLSPRTFYWKLTELYQKVRKTTHTPLSLHGQLLWREFFFTVACNNNMFDRMVDNPICIQIPWDKNTNLLDKWANGETGFPWIDAIMTQLRLEGWIHPLARHAVACFLTRGDLWISWEEGMKVFDEYLLDADWSVNAGNWIWLSCSSFYQQFFHCYCPVKFGRRTDPNGDYVRKYLPILKNFPSKYIFEPWTAPEEVQEKAKCIIGKDYPQPIVDHAEASHRNIEKMRKVYNNLSRHGGPGLLGSVPSSKEASGPPSQKQTGLDSSHLRLLMKGQQSETPPNVVGSPGPSGVSSPAVPAQLSMPRPRKMRMSRLLHSPMTAGIGLYQPQIQPHPVNARNLRLQLQQPAILIQQPSTLPHVPQEHHQQQQHQQDTTGGPHNQIIIPSLQPNSLQPLQPSHQQLPQLVVQHLPVHDIPGTSSDPVQLLDVGGPSGSLVQEVDRTASEWQARWQFQNP